MEPAERGAATAAAEPASPGQNPFSYDASRTRIVCECVVLGLIVVNRRDIGGWPLPGVE